MTGSTNDVDDLFLHEAAKDIAEFIHCNMRNDTFTTLLTPVEEGSAIQCIRSRSRFCLGKIGHFLFSFYGVQIERHKNAKKSLGKNNPLDNMRTPQGHLYDIASINHSFQNRQPLGTFSFSYQINIQACELDKKKTIHYLL